jgi:hypothetical protein
MNEPQDVKTVFFADLVKKRPSEVISQVEFTRVVPCDVDPASQSSDSFLGSEAQREEEEERVVLFEFEQSALFHDQ